MLKKSNIKWKKIQFYNYIYIIAKTLGFGKYFGCKNAFNLFDYVLKHYNVYNTAFICLDKQSTFHINTKTYRI